MNRFSSRSCFLTDYDGQYYLEELVMSQGDDGELNLHGGLKTWVTSVDEPKYRIVLLNGNIFTTDKGNKGTLKDGCVKEVERIGQTFRIINWPAIIKLAVGAVVVKIVGCYAFDASGRPAFFTANADKAKLLVKGTEVNLASLASFDERNKLSDYPDVELTTKPFVPADDDFAPPETKEANEQLRQLVEEVKRLRENTHVLEQNAEAMKQEMRETVRKLSVKDDTFTVTTGPSPKAQKSAQAAAAREQEAKDLKELSNRMGIRVVNGVVVIDSLKADPLPIPVLEEGKHYTYGKPKKLHDPFAQMRKAAKKGRLEDEE